MNRLFLKGFGGLLALSVAGLVFWPQKDSHARQDQPPKAQPQAAPAEPKLATLPLTQAVLYTNGVGYFEREGTIQGDAVIELQCRLGEVNDLLKSLVVQDLDRGKVGAVTLAGPVEPYSDHDTLENFIENNPTWQDILLLARGTSVEVMLEPASPASAAPPPVTGVVISIQTPPRQAITSSQQHVDPADDRPPGGGLGKINRAGSVYPVKLSADSEGQKLQVKVRNEVQPEPARLQLLTSQGYVTLRLDYVKRVKLLDPVLENSIRTALAKVPRAYQALGNQQTSVRLRFDGVGQRRVRIGYLCEQPMWKSSYRLILDEKAPAQLQGWAIVENNSDEDWQSIRLKLVAGQPVSFRMDLHTSLQPKRPEADVSSYRPFLPHGYQALFDRHSGPVATLPSTGIEAENAGAGFGLGGLGGGGGYGRGGMGGMGGMGGGMGGLGGAGLSRMPNRVTQPDAGREGNGERENSKMTGDMASTAPVGSYFEYVMKEPVILTKGKTSLVPLFQTAISVERLSLLQSKNRSKKPLLALRLHNDSKLLLGAGPVTIFDRRQYAGEAQLPEVAVGAKTFLTYGLDALLQVEEKSKSVPLGNSLELSYSQLGGYSEKVVMEQTDSYLFTNRDVLPRQVLIEQPRRKDVSVVKPMESKESDDQLLRFQTAVAAGQRGEFTIVTSSKQESKRDQYSSIPEKDVKIYRVDNFGTMSVQQEELPVQAVSVAAKTGNLILTNRLQRRYLYTLRSTEGRPWSGNLKHAIDHSWVVSSLPDRSKVVNAELIIPFTVAVDQSVSMNFMQEKLVEGKLPFGKLTAADLSVLLRDRALPAELKVTLEKVLTFLEAKAQLDSQQSELQNRLKEIDVEQNRLRANMKDLPKEAPLYKRYLEKFDKQEQEIDNAREQSRQNKQKEVELLKNLHLLEQKLN